MNLIRMLPTIAWAMSFVNGKRVTSCAAKVDQLRREGRYEEEQEELRSIEEYWGQVLCEKFRINLQVTGETDLPEGPVVFVANHVGYCDIPLFFAAIPQKSKGFIAKEEVRKVPFYGVWMERVRCVFLKRDNPRDALRTFDRSIENLKEGASQVIFPEGTRSKGGPMKEFKKGSLRLATKSGFPVVPVTIWGTQHIYEDKECITPGCSVTYHIHPAIDTKGMEKKEAADLAARVEAIVRAKYDELRGEKRTVTA